MLHINHLPGLYLVFQSLDRDRRLAPGVAKDITRFCRGREIVLAKDVGAYGIIDNLAVGCLVIQDIDKGACESKLPNELLPADFLLVITGQEDLEMLQKEGKLIPHGGVAVFESDRARLAGVSAREFAVHMSAMAVEVWLETHQFSLERKFNNFGAERR